MDEHSDVAEEIERLHFFFEEWFSDGGDRRIEEFSDSLDDGFHLVSPDGSNLDKTAIVGIVEDLGSSGRVEIRIKNVVVRHMDESGLCIATYEEHQKRRGNTRTLISTVGFHADPSTPGGYRWLFVHETLADS